MKKLSVLLMLTLVVGLTACGKTEKKVETKQEVETSEEEVIVEEEETVEEEVTKISLSNGEILVNEEAISEDAESDVYKANDIIFYLEDQGIEYGAGTAQDEHSQIEADAHTVVHITKPGTYEISGTMEAGQIFVDLGEDAKEDPEAVVTLLLNNADITCTVAPAIFFYNVYECAEITEEEDASMEVITDAAGANLKLADDTKNQIYGSYVAKIYKSCELNEEGTEVVESKKLHKYDGAVYSRMTMNVFGDTGILDITAENEGLDTEMHLTIQGGNVRIKSGNDGINVNEDNVSVFTMNDGTLNIQVTGETGEGDGIDSNGWLVINGGTVNSWACAVSQDAGLDADMGIYINGGTVAASGNMPSEISEGNAVSVNFQSREQLAAGETYEIMDAEENLIMEVVPKNAFTMLVISDETLTEDGTYTLWLDGEQVAEGMAGGMMGHGMGGGMKPDGEPPEGFQDGERLEPPEGFEDGERPEPPEGFEGGDRMEKPDGMKVPDGTELPDDAELPEAPNKK